MTSRILSRGLAPSRTLAPSGTLAPSSTIYAPGPITPHIISMAVGTNNLLNNVSAYVEFGQGITYNYGRASQFDAVSPGTFTFTLDNSDGRFTPDNPTSPLATKVTEGMTVLWQLGARYVMGSILSLTIPADEASWHHLVVTCDDMLGTAGRHWITNIPDGLFEIAGGDLMWKLDEPAGDGFGAELNGDGLGPFALTLSNPSSTASSVTFGATQPAGLPGTAVTVTAGAGETARFGTQHGNTNLVSKVHTAPQSAGVAGQAYSLGWWHMWVFPGSTVNLGVVPKFGTENPGYAWSMQIQCTPTTVALKMGSNTALTVTLTAGQQVAPHYYEMQVRQVWQTSGSYWALFGYLYVDGVYQGATPWYDPQHLYSPPQYADAYAPVEVSLAVTGGSTPLSGTVERVSHSSNYTTEFYALRTTLEDRRIILDAIGTDINSQTYHGPLSTAPIGTGNTAATDATILDIYNDIMRSESGHMFCTTSQTSPNVYTQYIQIRARDRPQTPKAVFDVVAEGDGLPAFVRDITNVAAQVQVTGPTDNVIVADPTIKGRYITKGLAETVLYTQKTDLTGWGQDRLQRGKNLAVRAQTFSVDAVTTPTDRSMDLLALVPGDRVRLSNLPSSTLGFTTWDGWLLGASESHGVTQNQFTFTLAPTLLTPAAYDAGNWRYANGGAVTLANPVLITDTTITVTSTTGATMSTSTPYVLTIGAEQAQVTAVSGNTLTVTRGYAATTATAHPITDPIELAAVSTYAY